MSQVVCHPLPLPSIDIYANTPCLLQSISSIDCLISTVSRQTQLSTIVPVAVGVVIRSRYTAVRKTLTLPVAGRGVCRARHSPPHKPVPLGKRSAYNDPVICTPHIISTVRSKFIASICWTGKMRQPRKCGRCSVLLCFLIADRQAGGVCG